jgi:hypothetical protein
MSTVVVSQPGILQRIQNGLEPGDGQGWFVSLPFRLLLPESSLCQNSCSFLLLK